MPAWDLTALLNAADAKAERPARNLWLARLLQWLRHAPAAAAPRDEEAAVTPAPVLRLKHLLNVLERHPEHAQNVAALWAATWRDMFGTGLFADVGFADRMALWSEVLLRLRLKLLPGTVDTQDLGELFSQLFSEEGDIDWLQAIDDDLLERLAGVLDRAGSTRWREAMGRGMTVLVSAVQAAGLSAPLRVRMSPELLEHAPFEQLGRAGDELAQALRAGDHPAQLRASQFLRALLHSCRAAALSVPDHLESYGVSVDIMFEVEQLRLRTQRIEALLNCLVSDQPRRELLRLTVSLVRSTHARRSLRTLFARHYSLLARKMAERSAETGEHYITRDGAEYRDMLRRAAGGGLVMSATTFLKFAILALASVIGLSAFWSGAFAGLNYALSFVAIQLLHWTVATKQPAMTAPAMAHKLQDIGQPEGLESFVDEVVHLLRSQFAGLAGNLVVVAPLVLAVQLLARQLLGAPLVGAKEAEHVLHALSFLGPSLLFAAFTGVLLFVSSVIAGWVENWFVFYRLDAAIAWNPRAIARLGPARAQRWAAWWRLNISGLAANVSLGLMLGLVPALLGFIGVPLDVRHVTLSTGQLSAAAGALGASVLERPEFWWCVLATALTGPLNISVSFYLALKVALRSRGIQMGEAARVRGAIWRRFKSRPLSFFVPPRIRQR